MCNPQNKIERPMPVLLDYEEPEPDKCSFCGVELDGDDEFGYNQLGFCGLGCMLLDLRLRVDLLEARLKAKEEEK